MQPVGVVYSTTQHIVTGVKQVDPICCFLYTVKWQM